MSRYIDADAFDERIRISVGLVEEELTDDYKDGVRCTLELLKTQPTADVVEVVRCKNCVHCNHVIDEECELDYFECSLKYCDTEVQLDDYCSTGERREDDKG